MAPEITATGDGALLTWLEPVGKARRRPFAVRVAQYRESAVERPTSVIESPMLFSNWADFPSAVLAGDGSLFVHWLRRGGRGQYGIELGRRPADGTEFVRLGHPHRVGIRGEHGFVSMLPEGDGVRLFWLDGRSFEEHRRMELRSSLIVGDLISDEEVLDPDVCTCCQTSAVATNEGPLVVYRGRADDEIRDIQIVRRQRDKWTSPVTVADDGWVIPGCPVNGPAVAATDTHVAVAWFTGAESGAGVKVAFSGDAGATFAPTAWVDRRRPLGRVDIAPSGLGFTVAWLGADGDEAVVRTQEWRASEPAGPILDIARVAAARSSGFPRLASVPGGTILVWTDADGIRAARMADRRASPSRR